MTFRITAPLSLVLLALLSACEQASNNDGSMQSSKGLSTTSPIADYKTARSLLWRELYPNGGKTLYCQQNFDSQNRKGFNVEHVFPMSWATNGLKCGKRKQCRDRSPTFNRIEADLHNLFPARTDVNQDRSSFRFGEVKGEARNYGRQCDFETSARARVAEPAPSQRGEVARAMFYMAYQYKQHGLVLFKKQARLLEQWHKLDPPSKEEMRRNNRIEKLQGNRNPFVDQPDSLHRLINDGYFY